jgi:hypothetical protein
MDARITFRAPSFFEARCVHYPKLEAQGAHPLHSSFDEIYVSISKRFDTNREFFDGLKVSIENSGSEHERNE